MTPPPKTSKSFVYNLMGVALPIALTIFTTPIYLRHIGAERYGVLALVWLTVGYFGLLDLGLSRASANRLARAAPGAETSKTFWTAFWTSLALGCVGGVVLYAGSRIWAASLFPDHSGLRSEIQAAIPYIAIFIPVATANGILVGALEARHRFLQVNLISIVGSVLFTLLPLSCALLVSPSLALLIPVAILCRAITFLWLGFSTIGALALTRIESLSKVHLRDLVSYSGWAAVATIIGGLMHSVDQIAIGAVLGSAAVSYYVIPNNVVTRLSIIPFALLRALFPTLSQADATTARDLEYSALGAISIAMGVVCVGVMLAMGPFLRIWLGAQLVEISIPVGIILTVGIWFNSIANVPYWALQAQNRPASVATISLIEVVPYFGLLFFAMIQFGLIGAAAAWAIRTMFDAALLFGWSRYERKVLFPVLSGAVIVLGAAAFALTFHDRLDYLLVAAVVAAPILYYWAVFTDRPFVERMLALTRRLVPTASPLK